PGRTQRPRDAGGWRGCGSSVRAGRRAHWLCHCNGNFGSVGVRQSPGRHPQNSYRSPRPQMTRRRIVVVGTPAKDPFGGMAWMHLQIAAGLLRLGHDAYYMEVTSVWPFDPIRNSRVCDSDYAVPYLAKMAERFGLCKRWAYRRSFSDKQWFGLSKCL